jgi:hypothetical protein
MPFDLNTHDSILIEDGNFTCISWDSDDQDDLEYGEQEDFEDDFSEFMIIDFMDEEPEHYITDSDRWYLCDEDAYYEETGGDDKGTLADL